MVSGPGGVGKGTVVAELRRRRPELVVSVSATTRPPRPGELDGRDYHFIDNETFSEWIQEGRFLEWARFAGNRYGTPWSSVDRALEAGRPVVLEIDVQGAGQVRSRIPEAVLIFLAPPSVRALHERLAMRATDDPDRIAERLRIAHQEMAQQPLFDHVVVNDELNEAVESILRILDQSLAPGP